MKRNVKDQDKPIRHYFRIYFYKNGNENKLKGRIENITDDKGAISFDGVDSDVITGFISKHLSKTQGIESITDISSMPLQGELNTVQNFENTTEVFDFQEVTTQQKVNTRATPSVKLDMKVSEEAKSLNSKIIGSEIIAEAVETHEIVRLIDVKAELIEAGNITFSFSPECLQLTGTYRLKTRAWLSSPNKQVYDLQGSCWAFFL
jgi:hypothetical protein